jgi:sugar lactone lactonase YvrE
MTTKTYSILGALVAVLFAAGAQAQQVTTITGTNLLEPNSITEDPNNNIYFTDASDNRIVKFIPTSNAVSTLAGLSGPGFSGTNNGLGAAARFSQPLGIVYDPYRGGLVVVDQGNQVLRFVSLAGSVSNLAGVEATMLNPSGGYVDGPAARAQFSYPVGIATDGTNLYIADAGNNAIRRLDTNNNVATVHVTNYTFYSPEALVVDNANNLWIADTRNNTICVISNISVITNQTVTVVAGTLRQSGTNDSALASAALFDQPCGLLWDPYGAGLFISDTGNNTIRRLYSNGASGYSVQTLAGTPGVAGYVDGALGIAKFNNPVGMAVDTINDGYYVVDRGNNALRRLQTSPPQPAVSNPIIGYVTFQALNGALVSQFNPATDQTFNNPAIIAIKAESGVETFLTYGPTPPSPFLNTIPTPGPNSGNSPEIYAGDGLPPSQTLPSVLAPTSDETVYVVSEALGRTPSAVESARFRFVTANPAINGNNAASVELTDFTTNALMYYTLDGSTPTNDGSNGLGPVSSGENISFVANSNVTLTVKAFTPNFSPSGTTAQVFNASNYVGDQITFGFANGEASSRFVGSAGRLFYAPVTLTLLPNTTMYDLQFNLTVVPTNTLGGPAPAQPSNFTFNSMLVNKQTIDGQVVYITIPPNAYEILNGYQPFLFTNSSENLLGVGWLEINGETNDYFNDVGADLLAFSIAHETLFTESGSQIVVGGYSFFIPVSATNAGDAYQIQIGQPSGATQLGTFAPTLSVAVQPPTNGVLGAGAINSIKRVTTGINPYLVGDVYPFGWFNAGDFGSTNLQSADVVEVFRAAVYDNVRNLVGSDLFNALDSSDGSDNALYDGNDTSINAILFGDNALNVDDIYVTFRRSLDPALTWYERLWVSGTQYAQPVPNTGTATTTISKVLGTHAVANPASATAFVKPITVAAARTQAAASQTVQVPIQVTAASSNYPVKVMALNVDVIPLDGSPAITNTVTITPAANLGAATLTDSQGADNYAAAWLGSTNPGVSGTNILGTVSITLPPNVTTNSAYLVHFEHFSASPNGIALFQPSVKDGLVTVGSDRSTSSWNDGIPDWWRLTYFGTISNLLSAANLDPDGDGASNYQEYVAGTNPQDSTSVLQITPTTNFTLQWPSVAGKTYALEFSTSLFSTNWTVLCTNMVGTGQTMQIQDTNLPAPPSRFYRIVVQ